jgi:hypothetical protein
VPSAYKLTASSDEFVLVNVMLPEDTQGELKIPSVYSVAAFATPRMDCLPDPELI